MDIANFLIYILKVLSAIALVAVTLGIGWIVVWKYVLSDVPLFQEILGIKKPVPKQEEPRREGRRRKIQ